MYEKRTVNWSVRLSPNLRTRMHAAAAHVGSPPTYLVIQCIEALVKYVESEGELTLPLVVIPRTRWERRVRKDEKIQQRLTAKTETHIPKTE